MTPPPRSRKRVRCGSCHRGVELECRSLDGFWGYPSYNEYNCPSCGKRNVARCSGTVLSARVAIAGDRRAVPAPPADRFGSRT